MASKKITVDSNRKVALGSNGDYQQWLDREGVKCLIDNEGYEIPGYDLLVNGERYALGPPEQQQQQQRDGEIAFCWHCLLP